MSEPQAAANRSRKWAAGVAAFTMALTMLPYLWGAFLQGAGPSRAWFSWLGYNLDDSCVYLAWMRQVADGGFFQRNLFTTDPQVGHQFSLFILGLGWVARFTHLPLILVLQGARIFLGFALLHVVWFMLGRLLQSDRHRRAAFLVVCFGAGLGWLPGQWRMSGINSPVDVWQPEAITFLCLYQAPLFLISLALMVLVLDHLWQAEERSSLKPALLAGLAGLALGNIHTYDVITLMAVWAVYLSARMVQSRSLLPASWGRALVAGALTMVSTGYVAYMLRTEAVFAQRAAVPTLSPPIPLYLLGYGLLLPLAAVGWHRLRKEEGLGGRAALFLAAWAVTNVAVAYLPVPFQRKMLMGAHLPIAILAGVAVSSLAERLAPRRWGLVVAACVTLLGITNIRFMLRDARNFEVNSGQSRIQRPYMYAGEVAALAWIREHAPAGVPIQPLPWVEATPGGQVAFTDTTVACFAPGLTGHPVHAGHWGETPRFGETMGQWRTFLLPTTTDDQRARLLRRTGVRYILFTQKREETASPQARGLLMPFLAADSPSRYLKPIPEASSEEATLYEVVGL